MRSVARWLLGTVLVLDLVFAALLAVGGTTSRVRAETDAPGTVAAQEQPEEAPSEWTRRSLQLLGERLQRRAAELDQREAEIDELLRGQEVLALAPADEETESAATPQSEPTPEPAQAPAQDNEAFLRLQRAYENMEPETAARALNELASRDQAVVVELLLGWKPRTSGAILDALTTINAGLSADLSYEIWKRSGKKAPVRADSGR